jgi:hypothetical protein
MGRDIALIETRSRFSIDEETGDAQEEASFARGSSQALTLTSGEPSASMPRALSSQRLALSSHAIASYSVLSIGNSIAICTLSMTVDEAPVHEIEAIVSRTS